MYSSHRLRVILILLIVLCGVFAVSYGSRLAERSRLDAAIAVEQQKIAAAFDHRAELLAEIEQVNSPEGIDARARDDLDMALPGDKVLVLVQPTPTPLASYSQTPASQGVPRTVAPGDVPVWQQWVIFFTDEAGPTP